MASSSTLLCPGTLLLCRAQPQPCKEQHGQGSNEGPHHSGFAVEVRKKHVPAVLASASLKPPSHGQASRWSWQWRASPGALPHNCRLVEVGWDLWRWSRPAPCSGQDAHGRVSEPL